MFRTTSKSFVTKVGLAAASLAFAVAVCGAAISYFVSRNNLEKMLGEEAAARAKYIANHVGIQLQDISDSLSQMAQNTVFANALADSGGRETYLRPFLTGFRKVSDIPVRVVLSDFLGRPLESNSPNAPMKMHVERLRQVVDSGKPRMFFDRDGNHDIIVTMSWPVLYANTGLPEGTLSYQFDLKKPIGRFLGEKEGFRIHLEHKPEGAAISFTHRDAPLEGEVAYKSRVDLPHVFQDWSVVVEAWQDDRQLKQDLRRLALSHVLLSSLGLLIIVPAGLVGARRLLARLRSLETVALEVVRARTFDAAFPEQGNDEIANLGRAFNRMLEELRQVYEELKGESLQDINRSSAS